MELVHIQGTKVLLVLVLQEGAVKQQLLDLDQEVEQGELSRISNELNAHLGGQRSGRHRTKRGAALSAFARQVGLLVIDAMQRLDSRAAALLFRDGLAEMLRLPEFAEGQNVRKIVQVLEQPNLLEQIADSLPGSDSVHVMISGDGRYDELRDVSLVLSRYGVSDRVSGLARRDRPGAHVVWPHHRRRALCLRHHERDGGRDLRRQSIGPQAHATGLMFESTR